MSATLSQVDAILGKSAIKEHFWVKEGENLNMSLNINFLKWYRSLTE